MVLRPLPSVISPTLAPACPSTATIKGRGAPPGHHHTHPTLICSLPSLQCPPHRVPPPPVVPHRRSAVSVPPPPLLQPVRLTAVPSPFFSTAVRFHARGCHSGRSPASRLQGGVRGPPWTDAARGPPHRGLGPRNFPLKIKSGNRLFREFCKEAPLFL
jgi:hypothetical protein